MCAARDSSSMTLGHEDTHVLQCLLCHRVRLMYREYRMATEWERAPTFAAPSSVQEPVSMGLRDLCQSSEVERLPRER